MDQENMDQVTTQPTDQSQNQAPAMPPAGEGNAESGQEPHESNTHANMIIIGVFAVLVVALILIYIWGSRLSASVPEVPQTPQLVPATEPVSVPEVTSNSTDVDTIEADLNGTDLDDFETEMMQMEAELDASLTNQ